MGWGSGVYLFDAVVDATLKVLDTEEPVVIQEVVDGIYPSFAESDWDTESDSKYWFPYLLETMHNLGNIDDEDYAFYFEDVADSI